jgi:hypothetical protein
MSQTLSSSQLHQLSREGYLLLRSVLDVNECVRFDRDEVQPALLVHGGIDEDDPLTWFNDKVKSMATDWNKDSRVPIAGAMIRNYRQGNPIPDDKCLDMSPIHPILNQLHGDPVSWRWIHSSNPGWIHVRFPVQHTPEKWWHIDGGHFNPHFLDSPEQSLVVIPMIRSIANGGGNTHVLAKSHIYMTHLLHASGESGVPREITQDCRNLAKVWPKEQVIAIEPCAVGDVLLMHPFLVHAAGFTQPNHPLRIAFNMGVQWTRPVMCHKVTSSWLEKSIQDALQERPLQVLAPYPFRL